MNTHTNWRVLLDLDGTVAANAARTVAERHLGRLLTAAEAEVPLSEVLGLPECEFWTWWYEHQHEIYELACPIPGAVEVVRALKAAGAHIAVVTARRSAARAVTEEWLDRVGIPYDEMVMDADDKAAIARALGLNVGFEDDPAYAVPLSNVMPVILLPGAKSCDFTTEYPGLYRVRGWNEVPSLLAQIAKQSA